MCALRPPENKEGLSSPLQTKVAPGILLAGGADRKGDDIAPPGEVGGTLGKGDGGSTCHPRKPAVDLTGEGVLFVEEERDAGEPRRHQQRKGIKASKPDHKVGGEVAEDTPALPDTS